MDEALAWYERRTYKFAEGKRDSAESAERDFIDDKGSTAKTARRETAGFAIEVRGENFFHDCPLSEGGCKVCENGDGDGGCCWTPEE